MWADLRSALRNLRTSPAYALAATLTLSLAIAANTAIFGVVHAILLRPLPIHDPAQLAVVWESNATGGQPVMELSYRQFEAWTTQPHQVRAHVYRTAAGRAALGLTLGITSALAVTHWMRALLFGVSPVDPPTYAFVCATVGLTVLAVSLVPAARAARVDPIEILKRE